jgi:peptide/nickel transport system substrate-binding protein
VANDPGLPRATAATPETIDETVTRRFFNRRALLKGSGGTLAVGAFSSLLAACGAGVSSSSGGASASSSGASASAGSTASDSLTVATALTSTVFDPNLPAASLSLSALLYDSLFDTSTPPSLAAATKLLADFEPQPALATKWVSNSDGTEWTLTLNTSATSPYGNKLTSADVLWSFERNLGQKWYSGIFLNRVGITAISQVTAPDAATVVLKLPAVVERSYLLQLIGSFIVPIYDSVEAKKHVTAKDPYASKWMSSNACGFGPYTLKSFTSNGSTIVFEANPHYYGTKPIQTVTWTQTTETDTQLQLLLKGEAQLIDALSPTQVQTVQASATAKVTTAATTGAIFIGFNNSVAPFKDVALHQGIAYALPYDEIVTSVYKGQATPMKSLISSFLEGYTGEYWTYDQNLAKAKELLAPYAGQSITLQYESGVDTYQELAILIQSSLKAVGLNIGLEATDPNTFETKLTAAELTMWLDPFSTPLVPDSLYALQLLFPTKPTQILLHYSNADVDAAVAGLATATTTAEQIGYIKAAQKVLVEQLPILPLAQLPYISPSAKNVTGFRGHGANFMWVKGLQYT